MFTIRPSLFFILAFATITVSFTSLYAQQKGLLWQITGKGIKHPTYLYGTVHMFDTSLYRMPQAVLNKLNETKQVYFELDFSKINPMEMMSRIMIVDTTQRLDKVLDTASLKKLKELAKTSPMLQMLGTNLYRIKPVFLSALLVNNGKAVAMDMEMYKQARQLKDSVGGLETIAEQLQAIDAIPMATQVKMLQDMLKHYVSPDVAIRKVTETYVKQDIEHMMAELNENLPIDASFNETLIVKRNLIMANRMENLLGRQSTMVAVGSGHLGGPGGLIALLRKKGYILKPVPFSFVKVAGH